MLLSCMLWALDVMLLLAPDLGAMSDLGGLILGAIALGGLILGAIALGGNCYWGQ